MATKIFSITYYSTPNEVYFPWDTNNLNDDNKYVKKHEKFATFSKNAKIHDVKKLKTVPLPLETVQ